MSTETVVTHTPGPWSVMPREDHWSGQRLQIMADDDQRIAAINIAVVGEKSVEEGAPEANARLIAAAPELLEACRDSLRATGASMPLYTEGQIKKAIAKAEEEPNA